MIIETDRLEQEMEAGTKIWDCFSKLNIRRTEISIGVYTIQVLSGIYLIGYSNYFFTRKFPLGPKISPANKSTVAGLPTSDAFNMGVRKSYPTLPIPLSNSIRSASWASASSAPSSPGSSSATSGAAQSTPPASPASQSCSSQSQSSTACQTTSRAPP